jgi:hypothetical protein
MNSIASTINGNVELSTLFKTNFKGGSKENAAVEVLQIQ